MGHPRFHVALGLCTGVNRRDICHGGITQRRSVQKKSALDSFCLMPPEAIISFEIEQ
jgi:hypothetical protein